MALVAGGLSLIASLGGVVVGQWLQRTDAHASWLRERRLQACGDLLTGISALLSIAGELYYEAASRGEAAARMVETAHDVGRALDIVQLLGPEELAEAGREAVDAGDRLVRWALTEVEPSGAPSERPSLDETELGSAALNGRTQFIATAKAVIV